MKSKQCRGCGIGIQTQDPERPGYVPAQVGERQEAEGKPVICQRCYRITHYGQDEQGAISADQALTAVRSGIEWADGIILVVDLMDFEGSLQPDLVRLIANKPVVIAANKGDLLPPTTTAHEALEWVHFQRKLHKIPGKVGVISATTGGGFDTFLDIMDRVKARRWAVVGSTNVGKSTFIRRMLRIVGTANNAVPTVSYFPGTTMESTRWKLTQGRTLLDTPGIVPHGRVSDRLCPSCARKLIPHKRIETKLYSFPPGSIVGVQGIALVESLQAPIDGVVLGFTASNVGWHRVSNEKQAKWLESFCSCWSVAQWKTHKVKVPENHDVVVHGLGWVSVRKGSFLLGLTLPAGIRYSVRRNLVGPKKTT